MRYAEEANYWGTTVSPAKSTGEISEMLEEFGAGMIITMSGQSNGKHAWLIRFQWEGKSYRFLFVPLECKSPDKVYTFGGKRRTAFEQSRYQMGRIAVAFVKAILTAAEATPHALFGFMELPASRPGGIPPTAAELDVSGITPLLSMPDMLYLEEGER